MLPVAAITIPPVWSIVVGEHAEPATPEVARKICLTLRPGPGFGNGAHETTQLCLQAIHAFRPRTSPWRLLDFGSGSGILSIAGAKLGAEVQAVEIDELAIAHAEANVRINAVQERVHFSRSLADASGTFELVVANILLPVLTGAAAELVARRAPRGVLVLSGLVSTDVPEAIARYTPLFDGKRPEIYEQGAWRALTWGRVLQDTHGV